MKTYKLELVLIECSDKMQSKILRREELGCFATQKEAQELLELVELPDPKHSTII
ncbi:MAG TPA: hypothetical protein VFM25_14790 [Verrucomicrobiae bacterium]|nr:hypothetical protein [Verrucomicrobiae bacterium]